MRSLLFVAVLLLSACGPDSDSTYITIINDNDTTTIVGPGLEPGDAGTPATVVDGGIPEEGHCDEDVESAVGVTPDAGADAGTEETQPDGGCKPGKGRGDKNHCHDHFGKK